MPTGRKWHFFGWKKLKIFVKLLNFKSKTGKVILSSQGSFLCVTCLGSIQLKVHLKNAYWPKMAFFWMEKIKDFCKVVKFEIKDWESYSVIPRIIFMCHMPRFYSAKGPSQ